MTQIASGVPSDWIIIGSIAILITIFSMLRGTSIATALSLSLPVAVTLFSVAPNAFLLGSIVRQFHAGLPQALVFLAIEIILLILFIRATMSFSESSSPLAGILVGVSTTVVLVCIWMQVGSLASIWHFSSQTQNIFGSSYELWWLIVAYIGIAFARS